MSLSSEIVSPLKACRLQKVLCDTFLPKPPKETLQFGAIYTDHMLEVDWNKTSGWGTPQIKPFANLSLHPGVTSLHYGLQVFEGLKAFRSEADNTVRLFRPDKNAERMKRSSERITLPSFESKELVGLIKELVKVDEAWCPAGEGYSLYIRPVSISTESVIGVGPPSKAKLYVLMTPVGPYFTSGFKPIQLLADSTYMRAFPGGGGDCKIGGNYATTILPQKEAMSKGFTNLVWLFPDGNDFQITECGAMNIFILWKNENGEKELVTPTLESKVILPGVTRLSILELAREMKPLKVSEKVILMKRDFVKAMNEKRILEVFCCGTAVTVCPVNKVHFENVDYDIPVDDKAGVGEFTLLLREKLYDIQYGRTETAHEWAVSL